MKRSRGALRIALSGGGTGGHVYPSLAIYSILRARAKRQKGAKKGARHAFMLVMG